MWSDGRRTSALWSLLAGAVACGLVGSLVAQHALVGFAGDQRLAAAIAIAGLGLVGVKSLQRGLQGLRCGPFERLG